MILVIGTIIAMAIRKVATRLLRSVKVDGFVDRTGLGKTLRQSGVGPASGLLVKVLYVGIMLLVLQLAIGALGKSPIIDALNSMLAYVPKIIVATRFRSPAMWSTPCSEPSSRASAQSW